MLMTKRKPATIGEILVEEFMKPIGLTQGALAEARGVQCKHVNELCNDRRNVTAPTALIRALASRTRAGRTCSTADSRRMTCVPATPVGPWADFCSEVPGHGRL